MDSVAFSRLFCYFNAAFDILIFIKSLAYWNGTWLFCFSDIISASVCLYGDNIDDDGDLSTTMKKDVDDDWRQIWRLHS